MNSNNGRRSAADMRMEQKQTLAQAEAVQKTVAVMEPNWKALISSQKQQVETLAQILERLSLLMTKEDISSLMQKQINTLEEHQESALVVLEDFQKVIKNAAKCAEMSIEVSAREAERISGRVKEEFSRAISEEKTLMKQWSKRSLLITMIPSVLLVILELILHLC